MLEDHRIWDVGDTMVLPADDLLDSLSLVLRVAFDLVLELYEQSFDALIELSPILFV